MLDCPQYTRPAEFRGWKVPEVLLGGNHEEIRSWRRTGRAGEDCACGRIYSNNDGADADSQH